MLVSMIVISMIIQAPLEGVANADKTPNPSKAPGTSWTFRSCCSMRIRPWRGADRLARWR